ncbi:hypothetical protein BZA05DRAFT_425464 [Tricharina praecox]|uniref:uncharacterized protein n=1 Tax=Tricharina praecox TaxID=43433 RepID=UPI00221EC94F|nr:uncharacterized protein BZA05DRAFT_425464 [Tricharina praecox]KAI5852101.1 hypothetical protein BZA05DRAFT_425464 [Tricharina praecox]
MSTPTIPPREPYTLPPAACALLLTSTRLFVRDYMSRYDASHDWAHIERVSRLATRLTPPSADHGHDALLIQLAALLHDVGDHKYSTGGDSVESVLLGYNCPAALARGVAVVVAHVSYSSEIANPAAVRAVLAVYPELAVVQDADRLDALGAVGIARCFVFGGVVRNASLQGCVEHFGEKLVKIQALMKTRLGRELAVERTRRVNEFWGWWREENGEGEEEVGVPEEKVEM